MSERQDLTILDVDSTQRRAKEWPINNFMSTTKALNHDS